MTSPERTVLFFAKAPHNVAVYERVLRRLLADRRIRLYATSKNDRYRPANAFFGGFDLPGMKVVHRWRARRLSVDLYLSPDVHVFHPRSRVKVHSFHGISIKGQAYTTKVKDFDRLFLIGPYMRRRFAKLGVLGDDDSRFVDVGMPKTDAFFDGSLDRTAFLAARDLDPRRPTVLYAPTWRPESSLHRVGEELIRSMRETDTNFIVKLHDHSYEIRRGVDWRRKLEMLRAPNVHVYEEADVTPALHAADLLISDASSVANEFTLLDRPIVFVDVPELMAKYGASVDREDWGQRAGAVAGDVPEIHRCIQHALAHPDERGDVRRRIAAEGFYNPGRATDAAVAELYRLLDLDPL